MSRVKESLSVILKIVKKELRELFVSPSAYIVLVVFLFLWEFLFFRSAFLAKEASVRLLFDLLPWLLIFFVPAITMGSIAQERSRGTLEFILTNPVRNWELIMGKFFGLWTFSASALIFSFSIALSFAKFAYGQGFDWGAFIGQYIAGLFAAGLLIALGIFISSLFTEQVPALLLSIAASFFLFVFGFGIVTSRLPLFLMPFAERISLASHYFSMARGVIDTRDVLYFALLGTFFLGLAFLTMLRLKFGKAHPALKKYQAAIIIGGALIIGMILIGDFIPGRADLTRDKLYTLSTATRKFASSLTDKLTITLYASKNLPAEFQANLRDIKDILRDYKVIGKGKIIVIEKDPSTNKAVADEARQGGIQEVRFQTVRGEEFQANTGFLGLAIAFGEKKETIPFIKDTTDLEYQITSAIAKLTVEDKKKILFLTGHGEKNIFSDYRTWVEELRKQFEVESFEIGDKKEIPADTAVLVIAGPSEEIKENEFAVVESYLKSGGSLLVLVDRTEVDPQFLLLSEKSTNINEFLEKFGIEVKPVLVYDLRSYENIQFGGGAISYILPYHFWVRSFASNKIINPVTSKVKSFVFPWGNEVVLNQQKLKEIGASSVITLFSTTRFGGVIATSSKGLIQPGASLPTSNLSSKKLAVAVFGSNDQQEGKDGGEQNKFSGRIIVAGDSDFLTEQFTQRIPENLALGIEMISWLAQEESLAGIRLRTQAKPELLFENSTQISLVKFGNLALAVGIPGLSGFVYLVLLRSRKKKEF